MKKAKDRADAKPRGRMPTVHLKEVRGGVITVRLPKELHQKLADHCRKVKRVSINSILLKLIETELTPKEEPSASNPQ